MFGFKSADVQGRSVYDFLPKEIVQSVRRLDEEVRTKQRPREGVQLTYKNAKGEERTLSVTKVLTPAENGKSQAILTAFEDVTVRRRYEQDLLQNRTLLRAVLDNVPLGLYTRDCDNQMTFFNRQSMTVLGETDVKCVNTPHPHQDSNIVQSHYTREQQVLKEGKIKDYPEEVYVDHDGNEKILHLIKVPLMDAGPKPLVLSIVEDVTERRRQEKEIARANSFLSAIVQNAPIGLYARGQDGRMLLRNKQCEHIFGEVSEESFDATGSLPHETPEQVHEYIMREREVLDAGKTLNIPEEEYLTAGGEKKLLHMVKVPVDGGNGEPQFVVTLVEDITERKAQERTLVETKNFLQTLLDQVPVAIYARGQDDKLSFINRRAHELFPDEREYQAKDDFYGQREKAIFNDGKMVEFPEEWYTTLRGDKILLHLIKAPVFDKEGKPFMVLTVAEDITEKKAQEKAIIDARNFLQTVINNLPVSLSVKNYDGKYILWNKKSEELFGVTADAVIGRTSYRADINKEQAEFLREADLRVFESKKEQNIPQELISTASEGVKIMHTVKTPVFNVDGTPNCLLVVSEDITAKTKMEKQIREASDKNTLLVENAREGIVILEDGKVIYANRALCHILGYDEMSDVTGKDVFTLVADDHRVFLKDKYDAVLAGSADASSAIDVHFLKKNGLEVETEFAAVVSRYLGRRIVLCFVRDVTTGNRMLRDVKTERECFRAAFEKSVTPAFILSHKGYISVMNEACRTLFGFTEADKNFYRNVYMKPAVSLPARKLLRAGKSAHMDYVFDFDRGHDSARCKEVLERAQEEVALHGKTSFKLSVRKKDGDSFAAQVVVTVLDLPSKDAALVVVHDLSEQLDEVAKDSKEAQELKSVRQALPGLYLKTDSDGRVLEVYSNLTYLDNTRAAETFLEKKPAQYWPEEAASRALFAIKESLSINVSTRFEFEWTAADKLRYFEATVTPITGRDEAVLWVKDVSDRHAYDEQIHELYRLTSEPGLSITEQVDKILAFGLKTFRAEVGLVLRFEQGKLGLESHVVYATKNNFNIERYMEFPVEECLIDVPDGNVVIFPDLENASCLHCLHKEKGFGSLLAAPLYVGGKVLGALCFAAREPRRSFGQGAEELMGIMSRLLSLRIELRQTGKMLSEASRSLARTLEYVEMPAVMMDLDYQVTFVNKPFLEVTGRRVSNMLGRDLFAEVIRNDDLSKRMFKAAEHSAAGNAFRVRMDLLYENGLYKDTGWDVFACKDADGKVDGYALIASES